MSAKLLALLQITQTGTLYVYQGEEIGLKNFPRSWGIEEYKDVASINYWNLQVYSCSSIVIRFLLMLVGPQGLGSEEEGIGWQGT